MKINTLQHDEEKIIHVASWNNVVGNSYVEKQNKLFKQNARVIKDTIKQKVSKQRIELRCSCIVSRLE